MIEKVLLAGLLSVGAFWITPVRYRFDCLAILTMLTLLVFLPLTVVWLVSATFVSYMAMRYCRRDVRGISVVLVSLFLVGTLLVLREGEFWGLQTIQFVGIAYFVLRQIHVLVDCWIGKLECPSFWQLLRYLTFPPIVASGPIHRFQNFQTEIAENSWSAQRFYSGAERILIGTFMVMVIAPLLNNNYLFSLSTGQGCTDSFGVLWLCSMFDWIWLFFSFAGFTHLALGFSLMMGVKLEENFNQPWRASDLVDFWSRWHMTLSLWVRDYVFKTVSFGTRSPLIGVFAAMGAIGLWHETSWYYTGWAAYQAAGIALSHWLLRTEFIKIWRLVPQSIISVLSPVLILAWLSGAKPLLTYLYMYLS